MRKGLTALGTERQTVEAEPRRQLGRGAGEGRAMSNEQSPFLRDESDEPVAYTEFLDDSAGDSAAMGTDSVAGFWPGIGVWIVISAFVLIVIVALAWYWISQWTGGLANLDAYVSGPHVDKLDVGAAVAVGSLPVGRVVGFEVREGRQVAHLKIEKEHAQHIPADSRFRVDCLNNYWPGRLGVRILPPESGSGGPPLTDGKEYVVVGSALPPQVPRGFYALLGGVLLLFFAAGVAFHLSKRLLFSVPFLAAIVIAIAYFSSGISA